MQTIDWIIAIGSVVICFLPALWFGKRSGKNTWEFFVSGRAVLNGFAYTGTASAVVARAGASAVTTVDLSSGVLAWARDNFRLSGLDPDAKAFRCEASDAARFLEAEGRAGRRSDATLLDPPAFPAARGGAFAIDRDYPDLVARASRLLAEGGLLWLASVCLNDITYGKIYE